jgi:hypothetical protein
MLSMSIDNILYEKAFVVDENDVAALEIQVGPMTNEVVLLFDARMVD